MQGTHILHWHALKLGIYLAAPIWYSKVAGQVPLRKIRLPQPGHLTASFSLPVLLFLSAFTWATPVLAEPELRATAHAMRGVTVPKMAPMSASANQSKFSLGSDQSKFNLGTDQSKFNLGTNRNQGSAKSAVGI